MTAQIYGDRNPTEGEMPSYSRRELRLSDVIMIGRIVLMVLRIELLQKRISVRRLVSSFDAPANPSKPVDIGRIHWMTRGILRRMFAGRYCMKRSLVLFHFLRKAGRDAEIVFGVAKAGEKLEGHAWVTVNGQPFAEEGPVDRYAVTYKYP